MADAGGPGRGLAPRGSTPEDLAGMPLPFCMMSVRAAARTFPPPRLADSSSPCAGGASPARSPEGREGARRAFWELGKRGVGETGGLLAALRFFGFIIFFKSRIGMVHMSDNVSTTHTANDSFVAV